MENSGDPTRAFLFVLIVLMLILQSAQSDTVECLTTPSLPECADDCNGNKWFHHIDKGSCQKCPVCGPGQGLDSHCGGQQGQNAKCVPCIPGVTFSDPSGYCYSCRQCDNTVGDTPCTITTDAVCGKCQLGHYHEKGKPDQCHPCDLHSQPEQEPQCQVPPKLTTDPPQEGRQESTTANATLEPTLSDAHLPQETNHVSSSTASGDLADQVIPPTDISSIDAAVPAIPNSVSNATLYICVALLTIFVAALIGFGVHYKFCKTRIPRGATPQPCRQTNYVGVNTEDPEAPVVLDVIAETVYYRANGYEKHLISNAVMPNADEKDQMIHKSINITEHSSTSCIGPENASDYADPDAVKATSFEVLPKKRPDSRLDGKLLVFPSKQESSSGKSIICSGNLPGKASNVGTQHPTTEGWSVGVDSRSSMATSGYPDEKERVAKPVVTLCKDNGIEKFRTYQAASTLGIPDTAVSSAAVVLDVTAASLYLPSTAADTHADAALPMTDDSSAATVNPVTTGAAAVTAFSPATAVDEADGTAYLTEIEDAPIPAAGLINKETGACPESNSSTPLFKTTTSKKNRKSNVRVAPSEPDSWNGNKECSATFCNGLHINVNGEAHNVYIAYHNSRLNVGYVSTDTESDE